MRGRAVKYGSPGIQVIGAISAFVNHRLEEKPKATHHADWRVTSLQQFVDNQHGKIGRNLQQICGELALGISGSRLARLFSDSIGVGFREYTKKKRLRIAAQRLKNPTLSVKEIALDLGYHTAWDFQRQFKQLLSLTPTEFRKACEMELHSGHNETRAGQRESIL